MNSKREFLKLLLASFISQIGSHFLTISLSVFILMSTGSAVQSSLVFVCSFLPSVLIGPRVGKWVDENVSKWLIARNELVSIATTLLCGICIHFKLPIVCLCIVLGVRSILLFTSRAATTKWLKTITPQNAQSERIKLFYLAFFLSTAVSGVLASQVLKNISIFSIVAIDSLSYVIGLLVFLSLKPVELENRRTVQNAKKLDETLAGALKGIFSIQALRRPFLFVLISQAIFQGAYSALVSYLPVKQFHTGGEGIGWFQIAASIGITSGFFMNWFSPKSLTELKSGIPLKSITLGTLTLLALLSSVYTSSIPVSLSQFLFLNFGYEWIWLHYSSEFFNSSPEHEAARLHFTLSSVAAFFMALTTLSYSYLIEIFGAFEGVAFALVFLGMILLASFLSRGRIQKQNPIREGIS